MKLTKESKELKKAINEAIMDGRMWPENHLHLLWNLEDKDSISNTELLTKEQIKERYGEEGLMTNADKALRNKYNTTETGY